VPALPRKIREQHTVMKLKYYASLFLPLVGMVALWLAMAMGGVNRREGGLLMILSVGIIAYSVSVASILFDKKRRTKPLPPPPPRPPRRRHVLISTKKLVGDNLTLHGQVFVLTRDLELTRKRLMEARVRSANHATRRKALETAIQKVVDYCWPNNTWRGTSNMKNLLEVMWKLRQTLQHPEL
jgi:hypothetical protein